MDPGDAACRRFRPLSPPDAMGSGPPPPPPRPWSVSEVLGTGRLTNNFFGALSAQFQVTNAEGEALSTEIFFRWGTHAFLGLLSDKVSTAPGLERLVIPVLGRYGEVQVIYFLLSVPVVQYNPERRLFGCWGWLPLEGLLSIADIPLSSFEVRRVVSSIL